jgi:peroxiredoxin
VTGIDVTHPAAPVATATLFTLPAGDGSQVALADVLAKDHVLLVFYRGHW